MPARIAGAFGDGASGSGRIVTHEFSAGRTYTVTLTVTDAAGATASVAKSVSVGAVAAPTVVLSVVPDPPFVDLAAVFTAVATPAPGHSIQRYEWDFGDGTSRVTTVPTVTKTFDEVGTFVVVVTAVDDLNQVGHAAKPVLVTHSIAAPVANFTVAPSSPAAGVAVTFDASTSTVGVGATIESYLWDFGDGSATVERSDPAVTKTYGSPGTFVVRLTITDSLGRPATKIATVTVVP